jgi:hypothetical protein
MAAEPLDYRNAAAPDPVERTPPKPPRAAIPLEFDQVLTRTPDLAAARAIEVQLEREQIPVFRSEDAADETSGANDTEIPNVVLMVRADDLARATDIASIIFARRQRVRSFRR